MTSALATYPDTRFMGSKQRLLGHIADVAARTSRRTFVDAFSGSGCVAHHMKTLGYRVITNDVLAFAYHWARASIENSTVTLTPDDCELLLAPNGNAGTFIADTTSTSPTKRTHCSTRSAPTSHGSSIPTSSRSPMPR
jgi:DNA adenine methylase